MYCKRILWSDFIVLFQQKQLEEVHRQSQQRIQQREKKVQELKQDMASLRVSYRAKGKKGRD